MNKIEIMNEAYFMILGYHMFCFTWFVEDIEKQFLMGWSYIAFVAFLIICNMLYIILKAINNIRRKRYLNNLKNNKIKAFKLLKLEIE